ncbi:MAG TPA: hypothetical protein VNW29_04900 [Candidatus Sulfotelmatobacter sp.]|jgi:NTP pyrophosphatase (non-canonical NTP hydrolase)|nr:hypothetical protein [Candidatus Sulfotelmatobacter sp.]
MGIKTLTIKVEEVSQAYAKKFGIKRDSEWFLLKLQEELGELVQSYLKMTGQARKKNKTEEELRTEFRNEIADVLSHVLLLAKHYEVDLEKEIKEKWLVWTKSD